MKVRRYKKVNKNLSFFVNNFGFRQPYQVLVDGTFCLAALKNKVNIADNIPRYLHDEIKLITTPCVIIEMENLGKKLMGALLILKKYVVHKCDHKSRQVTGSDCLLSMLGETNDKHYVIATQDRDLQNKVRSVPGVPLLYFHIKTPVLEQPSEASLMFAKRKMAGLRESEKEALVELKRKSGIIEEEEEVKKRKKKKGPNPLSCKKKKAKLESFPTRNDTKSTIEKKKRKKIRIPKHVKEELLRNKING